MKTEDIGTGVPSALRLVGLNTMSLVQKGWMSRPDIEWLSVAGQRRWLVFSNNFRMLRSPSEREVIIRDEVGIVFLTSGDDQVHRVLWLLLVKWRWLELIDRSTPRPFVYFLSPRGRVTSSYKGLSL